jgi:hypothetical protein
LERFDDVVGVGSFVRDGNNQSEIVVQPIRCQIDDLISRYCRDHVVDQHVSKLYETKRKISILILLNYLAYYIKFSLNPIMLTILSDQFQTTGEQSFFFLNQELSVQSTVDFLYK